MSVHVAALELPDFKSFNSLMFQISTTISHWLIDTVARVSATLWIEVCLALPLTHRNSFSMNDYVIYVSKWFDFIRLIFGKICFKRHTWDWDFDIWLVGAAVFRQRTNVQKLILHRSLTSFLPFRQRLWHCDMMSAQLTFEIFKFHSVRFHLSFQWLLMMLCDLCLWSLAVNTQWLQRPGSYFSFTSS